MDELAWVKYVNAHIDPTSNLPRLDMERLERWQRLGLLDAPNGEYSPTDLERTLALLMLERAMAAKLRAGSA